MMINTVELQSQSFTQKIDKLEKGFKSISQAYSISASYIDLIIAALNNLKYKTQQQQYEFKTEIFNQQLQQTKKGTSFYQSLTVLLQQRQQMIAQMKKMLPNSKNKTINLSNVCQKLSQIRNITLVILQNIGCFKKKYKIINSPYLSQIAYKIIQDIDFLRFSSMRKYIQFSSHHDPLFLIPLKKFYNLELTSNYNRRSIVYLFSITKQSYERLDEADKILKGLLQNNIQFQKSNQLTTININQQQKDGQGIQISPTNNSIKKQKKQLVSDVVREVINNYKKNRQSLHLQRTKKKSKSINESKNDSQQKYLSESKKDDKIKQKKLNKQVFLPSITTNLYQIKQELNKIKNNKNTLPMSLKYKNNISYDLRYQTQQDIQDETDLDKKNLQKIQIIKPNSKKKKYLSNPYGTIQAKLKKNRDQSEVLSKINKQMKVKGRIVRMRYNNSIQQDQNQRQTKNKKQTVYKNFNQQIKSYNPLENNAIQKIKSYKNLITITERQPQYKLQIQNQISQPNYINNQSTSQYKQFVAGKIYNKNQYIHHRNLSKSRQKQLNKFQQVKELIKQKKKLHSIQSRNSQRKNINRQENSNQQRKIKNKPSTSMFDYPKILQSNFNQSQQINPYSILHHKYSSQQQINNKQKNIYSPNNNNYSKKFSNLKTQNKQSSKYYNSFNPIEQNNSSSSSIQQMNNNPTQQILSQKQIKYKAQSQYFKKQNQDKYIPSKSPVLNSAIQNDSKQKTLIKPQISNKIEQQQFKKQVIIEKQLKKQSLQQKNNLQSQNLNATPTKKKQISQNNENKNKKQQIQNKNNNIIISNPSKSNSSTNNNINNSPSIINNSNNNSNNNTNNSPNNIINNSLNHTINDSVNNIVDNLSNNNKNIQILPQKNSQSKNNSNNLKTNNIPQFQSNTIQPNQKQINKLNTILSTKKITSPQYINQNQKKVQIKDNPNTSLNQAQNQKTKSNSNSKNVVENKPQEINPNKKQNENKQQQNKIIQQSSKVNIKTNSLQSPNIFQQRQDVSSQLPVYSQQQKIKLLKKCTFISKSTDQSNFFKQISLMSPQISSQLKNYINSQYFYRRHLLLIKCKMQQQIISYCIYHPFITNQQRYLFILHFQIVNKKYQTLLTSILNTYIKYIFMNQPVNKIIYLHNPKTIKQPIQKSIQLLSNYKGKILTPKRIPNLSETSFLIQRQKIKCNNQQQYTSIINLNIFHINNKNIKNISTPNNIILSQLCLDDINSDFQSKPIKFNNHQMLDKYIQDQQFPSFSKKIQGQILFKKLLIEDCLKKIRFYIFSGYLYITIQPPFSYLILLKDVYYILLSTSYQGKMIVFGDKTHDQSNTDLISFFKQKIIGKKLSQLTNSRNNKKLVCCPLFKKTRQFGTNERTIFNVSLQWKDYLKGTKYCLEQDVSYELVTPFLCGLVDIEDNKINDLLVATYIQQRDITK